MWSLLLQVEIKRSEPRIRWRLCVEIFRRLTKISLLCHLLLNILTSPVIHWSLRSRPILSFKKTTRSFCLNQRLTRGHSLHSSGWNCRDGPSRGHHRVPVISLKWEINSVISYFLSTWTSHTWFSCKKHCKQERKHDEFSKRGANFCHMGFFFSCFYVSANGFFEIQELRIENWEHMFFFFGRERI